MHKLYSCRLRRMFVVFLDWSSKQAAQVALHRDILELASKDTPSPTTVFNPKDASKMYTSPFKSTGALLEVFADRQPVEWGLTATCQPYRTAWLPKFGSRRFAPLQTLKHTLYPRKGGLGFRASLGFQSVGRGKIASLIFFLVDVCPSSLTCTRKVRDQLKHHCKSISNAIATGRSMRTSHRVGMMGVGSIWQVVVFLVIIPIVAASSAP